MIDYTKTIEIRTSIDAADGTQFHEARVIDLRELHVIINQTEYLGRELAGMIYHLRAARDNYERNDMGRGNHDHEQVQAEGKPIHP